VHCASLSARRPLVDPPWCVVGVATGKPWWLRQDATALWLERVWSAVPTRVDAWSVEVEVQEGVGAIWNARAGESVRLPTLQLRSTMLNYLRCCSLLLPRPPSSFLLLPATPCCSLLPAGHARARAHAHIGG
jgi:hypothetical protein